MAQKCQYNDHGSSQVGCRILIKRQPFRPDVGHIQYEDTNIFINIIKYLNEFRKTIKNECDRVNYRTEVFY